MNEQAGPLSGVRSPRVKPGRASTSWLATVMARLLTAGRAQARTAKDSLVSATAASGVRKPWAQPSRRRGAVIPVPSAELIARETGFGTEAAMRESFLRVLQVAPLQNRRRFA
ncbi:hypothetical protein GCM10010300_68790 [Streptomyces olivaceoviridis]|nr:hypothetical protein GCM10010300_68790 [Streptomyces olivaceoviridis]